MAPFPDDSPKEHPDIRTEVLETLETDDIQQVYTLDKWRFSGIVGLVILNIAGGLNWPWFGSISAETASDFNISIAQVNWLGNVVNLVFLPCSLATPFLCKRYGIRACCFFGATCLVLAAWVRFAGTATSLSPGGAYALLFLGQVLGGVAQPLFQVLGPKFSEAWFDFNGRTTATMIVSVANPVGSALGQLIPSLVGSTRASILVLGAISTAVFPAAFLIYSKPSTPPSKYHTFPPAHASFLASGANLRNLAFSGSQPSPPPLSTIRSLLNHPHASDRSFPLRTRIDFAIITFAFGCLVAAANAFSLLTAQIFGPYGYSPSDSGLLGAALILSGLIAAVVTAPLFDRVFTRHVTITVKVATPLLALTWLSLIWAVRPNNIGGLFAVMAILGILSLMLLPLSLELACEISRDAETSSAILWFAANLLGVIFVLVEDALAAGANGSPPFNMRRSLIFVSIIVCTAACCILFFRGLRETRRALDAAKQREEEEVHTTEMSPIERKANL